MNFCRSSNKKQNFKLIKDYASKVITKYKKKCDKPEVKTPQSQHQQISKSTSRLKQVKSKANLSKRDDRSILKPPTTDSNFNKNMNTVRKSPVKQKPGNSIPQCKKRLSSKERKRIKDMKNSCSSKRALSRL